MRLARAKSTLIPWTIRDPIYAHATAKAGLRTDNTIVSTGTSIAVNASSSSKPSGRVAAATIAVTSVMRGGHGTISGKKMMTGVTHVRYCRVPMST